MKTNTDDFFVTQISQIQQMTFIFDHGLTRIDTDNFVTQISQILDEHEQYP